MGVFLSPRNWRGMHIEIRPKLEDDVPGCSCVLLFCCVLHVINRLGSIVVCSFLFSNVISQCLVIFDCDLSHVDSQTGQPYRMLSESIKRLGGTGLLSGLEGSGSGGAMMGVGVVGGVGGWGEGERVGEDMVVVTGVVEEAGWHVFLAKKMYCLRHCV